MTEVQLAFQERMNTGTAWTRNDKFEKDGYLKVDDLWDPLELYHPVPDIRGQLNYWDKNPEHFNHQEVEQQVEGSLARYWQPQYRTIHSGVRKKLDLSHCFCHNNLLLPTRSNSPSNDRLTGSFCYLKNSMLCSRVK